MELWISKKTGTRQEGESSSCLTLTTDSVREKLLFSLLGEEFVVEHE